jgi:hypothetical protein
MLLQFFFNLKPSLLALKKHLISYRSLCQSQFSSLIFSSMTFRRLPQSVLDEERGLYNRCELALYLIGIVVSFYYQLFLHLFCILPFLVVSSLIVSFQSSSANLFVSLHFDLCSSFLAFIEALWLCWSLLVFIEALWLLSKPFGPC